MHSGLASLALHDVLAGKPEGHARPCLACPILLAFIVNGTTPHLSLRRARLHRPHVAFDLLYPLLVSRSLVDTMVHTVRFFYMPILRLSKYRWTDFWHLRFDLDAKSSLSEYASSRGRMHAADESY